MDTTQQPIMKIKAGSVFGAIWENQITVNGQTKTILKATVSRRFKDKNGDWKTTYSFSRNDIPLAIFCLQKAFEAIIEKSNGQSDVNIIEQERVV